MPATPWRAPRDWVGERVFVVAGGPSVLAVDLDQLRGRRTIAIKTSWVRMPWADVLIYCDAKWWTENGATAMAFSGEIITTGERRPPNGRRGNVGTGDARVRGFYRKDRDKANGGVLSVSVEPDALAVGYSTVCGAANLAWLRGASDVILLGVDNGPDDNGRVYHHAKACRPPAEPRNGQQTVWQRQAADLCSISDDLRARGVTMVNTSPLSRDRLPGLPYRPLEECL